VGGSIRNILCRTVPGKESPIRKKKTGGRRKRAKAPHEKCSRTEKEKRDDPTRKPGFNVTGRVHRKNKPHTTRRGEHRRGAGYGGARNKKKLFNHQGKPALDAGGTRGGSATLSSSNAREVGKAPQPWNGGDKRRKSYHRSIQ